MTETSVDTLAAVQAAVAQALGIDESEAEPDATVLGDLDAESIDLLDILFRIERQVGVKIQASELAELLQGELTDDEFEGPDGIITSVGLAQLETVLPQIDRADLEGSLSADDVMTLFTVRNLADMTSARAARAANAS